MNLPEELKKVVKGEVVTDTAVLEKDSRDASVFEMKPKVVVMPQDVEDIKNLVKFVASKKRENPEISLTARSAGTDMSGGSLTDSIVVSMTEHLNHIVEVGKEFGIAEPGVYYRDFEKETLKSGQFFPSYPASKNICAIGGIINNNAGGEKSLSYGKTIKYVEEIKVVLRDGNEYGFTMMREDGLQQKMAQNDLEGEIYTKVYKLLSNNYELIQKHRPTVSKNSTGYQIWDVLKRGNGQGVEAHDIFDMSKLFVGSQGTLGLMTQVKLGLVPVKKRHGLVVAYMRNFDNLPEIVHTVLKYKPDSFESFDNYTFKLALRFFTSFGTVMNANLIGLGVAFIPEFLEILIRGMPRLILLVEFEEDEQRVIDDELKNLQADLAKFSNIYILKQVHKDTEAEKYWAIRRESFNLLRHKVSGLKAAPFIDDLAVKPETLPEFLPQLYQILDEGKLLYTVAGHIGDGNFHIIPLMNMADPVERAKIYTVGEKVFNLVLKYGGSLSGEHNDGLIRSPYIEEQFGSEIYGIFKQIKEIFDPEGIFNPHKKIGVTKEFAEEHMIKSI